MERVPQAEGEKHMSDMKKTIIKACEQWQKHHKGEPLWLEFSSVEELLQVLKEQPDVVRCKDCKNRSYYCTEATDGTTLYTCHHPCANDVPRPGDWFCADGKRKEGR